MGTTAVAPPAGMVTVAGTFAIAGLSERTDNVTAFGDANASAGITFSVDPFWIVCVAGPESAAETLTIWLAPVSPNAVALTAAPPKETPDTRGKPIGAVEPAGMYTFCGVTVSFEL